MQCSAVHVLPYSCIRRRRRFGHVAYKAIGLHYTDGKCKFAIPLPLNGFDQERVFQASVHQTVKQIVDMVKAEDPSVQSVSLHPAADDEAEFVDDMPLGDVIGKDFKLTINGHEMLVQSPVCVGK